MTLTGLTGFSQSVKSISGSYTLHAPSSMTVEEAKRVALDRAKINAVENAFGSKVTQNNSTLISNINGHSDSYFHSMGGSEIKGEWIETFGNPQFNINYKENQLIVECSVKGKVREIIQPEIEFETKVLKNGTTEKFISNDFHDGDDLYLLFKSSVDGHIAIFLNQNQQVYRLLPYKRDNNPAFWVTKNTDYTFFDKSGNKESNIDEYELYADNEVDLAELIILFTPSLPGLLPLAKDRNDEPLSMDFSTFNDWIVKKRNKDVYSRLIVLPITIKRK